jgi:ribosomal protein L16/L10AE
MPLSFTPALKAKLQAAGCTFARSGKGDPEIWYSPITDRRFVVDGAIKSKHTANAVLKQAGLPKGF